jgi:hypothetical protein
MSKLILIAATAALGLGACNYSSDYNNQAYNADNAAYSAEGANYSGNEAGYNNATDYNSVGAANTTENMGNAAGNASGNASNAVTNNGY